MLLQGLIATYIQCYAIWNEDTVEAFIAPVFDSNQIKEPKCYGEFDISPFGTKWQGIIYPGVLYTVSIIVQLAMLIQLQRHHYRYIALIFIELINYHQLLMITIVTWTHQFVNISRVVLIFTRHSSTSLCSLVLLSLYRLCNIISNCFHLLVTPYSTTILMSCRTKRATSG